MAVTQSTKKHITESKEESKIDKTPEMKTQMKEEKKTEVEKEIKSDIKKELETEKPKEKKKVEVKEIPKKDVAIANGFSLKISPKQSIYVCRVIRGKSPDNAVKRLQDVISEKRPVPMAGLEVGHKKGRGLAGGKFPKNTCSGIIEIIKQVKANAVVAGIENPIITIAKSDRASAPYRRAGRKAKRTHIHIEVRDKKFKLGKKKSKGASK